MSVEWRMWSRKTTSTLYAGSDSDALRTPNGVGASLPLAEDIAVRVKLFRFAGYPAGQTDFETVGAVIPGNPLYELDLELERMGNGINGTANIRSSITIVGHSDRQDRADMSCDQRRQSEIDASTARAVSAWEWIKPVVDEYARRGGWAGTEWWEESDCAAWALVYAACGMLLTQSHTEAERAQNRRVDILITTFDV